MFRAFRSARRKSSQIAMAIALAGGAAFGSAAFAPAAVAQEFSRPFVTVYQPVAALTQGETPDFEAAKAQLNSIYAAVSTPDDRHAAGNLTLIIGNQLTDRALQRRGLEMMIESGKVTPEQLPVFNFFVGNLAYNAGDFADARSAINAALAAGYADNDQDPLNDPEYIILQSHFSENNTAAGLAYLSQLADTRFAAGQAVPETWLLRGLQEAYDENQVPQATDISLYLLRANPTRQNWINALQVIGALNEFEPATRVDLFRLMRETDSLTQRAEYIRYVEDLDPRIMGNEVIAVLAEGVAGDIFTTSDPYYAEVNGVATPRAAADRRDRAEYLTEGESGDARLAMTTGNVLYSLDDFAAAERMFQLALERGFDANAANTRIGIAQVKQGKYADAVATFGNVSGTRAPIAQMWSTYAASLAN